MNALHEIEQLAKLGVWGDVELEILRDLYRDVRGGVAFIRAWTRAVIRAQGRKRTLLVTQLEKLKQEYLDTMMGRTR